VFSGGKVYNYSKHAIYQMRRRSISKNEIIECIENYDTRFTDKKGNPVYRARLESGRGIKVVIAKDEPDFIVTTADY
jgi:hypothetical protein